MGTSVARQWYGGISNGTGGDVRTSVFTCTCSLWPDTNIELVGGHNREICTPPLKKSRGYEAFSLRPRKTRQRKAWHPLAGGQSPPWPMTPWPKIDRGPPLIIHNLHVKFESDWAKTVVAIMSTRSYTQSAIVDLDLWPCDPKSIWFLLLSFTTYMWSLKVIGQKL